MATSTDYDLTTCSGCCGSPPGSCGGCTTPPSTMTGTLSTPNACTCLAGATVAVSYGGATWTGSTTPGSCGVVYNFTLSCVGGQFSLTMSWPGGCHANVTPAAMNASNCSPFTLGPFTVTGMASTCGCGAAKGVATFQVNFT